MLKPVFLQSPCRQQPSWTLGCQKKHKSEKLSAKNNTAIFWGPALWKNQNIQLNSSFPFQKNQTNKNTFLIIDARGAWLEVWLAEQPKKETKNQRLFFFFFKEREKAFYINKIWKHSKCFSLGRKSPIILYNVVWELTLNCMQTAELLQSWYLEKVTILYYFLTDLL